MAFADSITLAILSGVVLLTIALCTKRRRLPYPPGPKPLPILGNIRDLPQQKEALQYTQWAKEYGDIYHLSALGTHIVVVNSPGVANDLFIKRASNYSDRPRMTMVNELMGWDFAFVTMPFGDRWKRHRKMFNSHFRLSNTPTYHHIQRDCSYALLGDLLESPGDLENHLRHLITRSVTQIMYGITVAKKDDHYKTVAEQAFGAMASAASPGAFLVDVFPFLRYVPAWFPGAGFQKMAQEWKKLTLEMINAPYNAAQDAMVNGKALRCFVTDLTNELGESQADSEGYAILRNCAAIGFAAGVQTTSASLLSLFLALMLYPDVQKKAQEELDRVCVGRLPDFADRASLPYIDALCVELIRWAPVAPLGAPHMATKDDVYNGYLIPAGSIVIGNAWAMAHDEATYPNPSVFKPERFLSQDGMTCTVLSPNMGAFGFGRRKCSGRFLADAQLFITTASVLKVFNIQPPPEASGIMPAYEDLFTCRLESHPMPFKCSITPRGEDAVALTQNAQ